MKKKTSPLSWKLKLVLAYLYLTLIGSVVAILVSIFIPSQELKLDNPDLYRVTIIVSYTITVALISWVITCIHRRSVQATFAYIMMTVISYGIYTITTTWLGASRESVTDSLATLLVFIIDASIVVYMLKSSDIKKHLKRT